MKHKIFITSFIIITAILSCSDPAAPGKAAPSKAAPGKSAPDTLSPNKAAPDKAASDTPQHGAPERSATSCAGITDPEECSQSLLNCVWSPQKKLCEEDKTPMPTKCRDILKSDLCVISELGCRWVPDLRGVEVCQNAPTTMPVVAPRLYCTAIVEETQCQASLLGCTWDSKNNLCVESGAYTAQSCFQIKDPNSCQNFTAAPCRWATFSALRKSFCLPAYIPDDPQLEHQWHLLNNAWGQKYGINAIDAWALSRGDPGVVIGIVDAGFPLWFADFGPKCKNKKIDIFQNISVPKPPLRYEGFHGLSVAASGMACSNNKVAGSGVDHKAAVRVASLANTDKGKFDTNDIRKGIMWLANLGPYKGQPDAQIMNLSLGAFANIGKPFGYYGVIKDTLAKNIIVVAASGNEAENVVKFRHGKFPKVSEPASIAGVISVGASNMEGNAGSFSNWGPFVDIMAPGVEIMVNADDKPKTKFQYGTSFSSPIVSGVVGLMKAVYPGLTPQVAKHIVRQSAQPLSCNKICSHDYGAKMNVCKNDMCPSSNANQLWRPLGLVDAYKAVLMAQKGLPKDPIIQSDINWIGVGVADLHIKDGKFAVENFGPVDGEVSLRPNQDPNLVLAPTLVPANKRVALALSYTPKPAQQQSMIVYFDVHEKSTARYIDTFAIVVVIK